MKFIYFSIFIILFQFGYGQLNYNTNEKTFSASGDAILRVKPDQVVISLGAESRGKDLLSTKEKNHKIINQVIAYCKKQGIKENYIQTDYIKIHPSYQTDEEDQVHFYTVHQSLSIVLDDVTKYEEILTNVLKFGINRVENIEFRTTKLRESRDKVRKMAITAAKQKAEFLSGEVGLKLGKIVNINESVQNPMNSFSMSNYANISQNVAQDVIGDSQGETLSVGLLSLKAYVTLTYDLTED